MRSRLRLLLRAGAERPAALMMAAVALVLYIGWVTVLFGVRSVLWWRRTGDHGYRGGGVPRGSVQWWARLAFAAALVAGAAAPAAALAGAPPLPGLDHPAVRVAGLVVALAGAAGSVAVQHAMGASWRVGVAEQERTTLVTSGMFALARNPFFTAMAVTAAGIAAMVPNLVAVAALALLVAAAQAQVRLVEEPYLRRVHGAAYAAYAARVGRFLPSIGRLPADQTVR